MSVQADIYKDSNSFWDYLYSLPIIIKNAEVIVTCESNSQPFQLSSIQNSFSEYFNRYQPAGR